MKNNKLLFLIFSLISIIPLSTISCSFRQVGGDEININDKEEKIEKNLDYFKKQLEQTEKELKQHWEDIKELNIIEGEDQQDWLDLAKTQELEYLALINEYKYQILFLENNNKLDASKKVKEAHEIQLKKFQKIIFADDLLFEESNIIKYIKNKAEKEKDFKSLGILKTIQLKFLEIQIFEIDLFKTKLEENSIKNLYFDKVIFHSFTNYFYQLKQTINDFVNLLEKWSIIDKKIFKSIKEIQKENNWNFLRILRKIFHHSGNIVLNSDDIKELKKINDFWKIKNKIEFEKINISNNEKIVFTYIGSFLYSDDPLLNLSFESCGKGYSGITLQAYEKKYEINFLLKLSFNFDEILLNFFKSLCSIFEIIINANNQIQK